MLSSDHFGTVFRPRQKYGTLSFFDFNVWKSQFWVFKIFAARLPIHLIGLYLSRTHWDLSNDIFIISLSFRNDLPKFLPPLKSNLAEYEPCNTTYIRIELCEIYQNMHLLPPLAFHLQNFQLPTILKIPTSRLWKDDNLKALNPLRVLFAYYRPRSLHIWVF